MEIQPLYCLFTIGILIYFIRATNYLFTLQLAIEEKQKLRRNRRTYACC